jgi:multiple sugar transport system substrate-binding protein
MSDHKTGLDEQPVSRRDFLTTSAKVGAGVALAGTALGAAPRQAKAANVTLTYYSLQSHAGTGSVNQDMLTMFEKLHPGVKVNHLISPSTEAADIYHDKLVTILSAHDGSVDVFDSDVIWQAQWVPAGWVVALDKVFPKEQQKNYAPGMIWADTIGDHIYGIPWMLDTGHLFYRKDILDANGLKPAKTWQDLLDQGLMLQKKYPKMVPFVGCYSKGQQLICNFVEYMWSNGGDLLDPKTGSVVLNSPQNVQALEMMITYVNKKIVQPGIVSMNLDVGRIIFTQGNAIYHRNWNYAYALSQANPKLVGKVGVTNIPVFPGHPTASCAGGWQYVVNNYSKNRDLAIALATFMGSPKMEKYKMLNSEWTSAYLPAVYDKDTVAKFPYYPLLGEQAKTERSRPKTPFWTHISNAVEAELGNALTGSKSAQQALKDAHGQVEAILAGA